MDVLRCPDKASMERKTLSVIISDYTGFLQAEKRMAAATLQSYRTAAEGFLSVCARHWKRLHLPEEWTLSDLDKRAVEIYLNHLREERGWKPASLAQQASALRSLFGYLELQGYLERNPARHVLPKVPPREEVLPQGGEDAVRRLFDAAGSTLAELRLLLLLELFYGGALRGNQVYPIRSLRINRRAGVLKAVISQGRTGLSGRGTGGKGRTGSSGPGIDSQRRTGLSGLGIGSEPLEIPLAPQGLERARAYLEARKAIVKGRRKAPFWINARGTPRTPARLSRDVRQAMEKAGLEGGPLQLRQLSARHFMERGGDTRSLQRLLGAKRLGSLDRYAPPDYQSVLRQFRQAHPRGMEEEGQE